MLPAALHLARQVARADPADGALALELFRSNRFTGLLLFAGFVVIGLSSAAEALNRAAMLDPASASDTLASLIDQARRAGADAADAVYVGDRSTSVGVRLGALEDVSRAEGQEIGLRLFVGQRNAAVASSDLSRDSLAALGRARGGDGARGARGPICRARARTSC